MNKETKILTILSSPSVKNSNTRALAEDFVEEMRNAGLNLEHRVISLREKKSIPVLAAGTALKEKPVRSMTILKKSRKR